MDQGFVELYVNSVYLFEEVLNCFPSFLIEFFPSPGTVLKHSQNDTVDTWYVTETETEETR